MSIPEEELTKYLNSLFGRSEAGEEALHHLLVARAPVGDTNAFGMPTPEKLEVALYAIAPDRSANETPEAFVARVIIAALSEARAAERVIHFAGLAIEVHEILDMRGDEATENLARRLQADMKLQEHPDVVETTRLYAATSDGRRWTGKHILTGPQAGTIIGPTLHVGRLSDDEQGLHPTLIRGAVSHRR